MVPLLFQGFTHDWLLSQFPLCFFGPAYRTVSGCGNSWAPQISSLYLKTKVEKEEAFLVDFYQKEKSFPEIHRWRPLGCLEFWLRLCGQRLG